MPFEKIPFQLSSGKVKTLFYCTCGGATHVEAYKRDWKLCFDLICRGCGAREPIAYFNLIIFNPNDQLFKEILEDYAGTIEWKEKMEKILKGK